MARQYTHLPAAGCAASSADAVRSGTTPGIRHFQDGLVPPERGGWIYHSRMLRRGGASLLIVFVSSLATGCAYSAQKRATGWLVVETENVRVRTNLSRRRAAKIALEVQRIRDVLEGSALRCAFQGRQERIPVTVLSSSEYGEIAPKGTGAFYRAWRPTWLPEYAGQLVVTDDLGPDVRQALQHELTHHLVAVCFPAAPRWLHEGLASFLETATVSGGKVTYGQLPYLIVNDGTQRPYEGHTQDLRVVVMPMGKLATLKEMLATPADAWFSHDAFEAHAKYATAWALVHFLEIGAPDLRSLFHDYLLGLQHVGADPEALFAMTYQGVPLQQRLNDYLVRGEFPLAIAPVKPVKAKEARTRAMSEGEAHVHWAWLWSGVAGEDRRERVREHLSAASTYPGTRAQAYLLGALLRADDDDLAGAERDVVEGLRAAPRDRALLEAHLELLLFRHAPVADLVAAAEPLRPVARTADQICALGGVELARGEAKAALVLALRGRAIKSTSWLCDEVDKAARQGLTR